MKTKLQTGSGFHAKSTGAEVLADIDLTGNTAIVTGGYSGIGLETVRALASKGTSVIVPVRSREKAKDALAGIEGSVSTAPLDLADLGSVQAFVTEMVDTLSRLDLLINNAGIMACPEARVGPGWESQFGTNHMGHFALTIGLMPLMRTAHRARALWRSILRPRTRCQRCPLGRYPGFENHPPTTNGRPMGRPRPPMRCSPMR